MVSLERPSCLPKVVKDASLKRLSPPPELPIHRLPSRSCVIAQTSSPEKPSLAVKRENLPSQNLPRPPPIVPIHRAPELSSNIDQMLLSGKPSRVVYVVTPAAVR